MTRIVLTYSACTILFIGCMVVNPPPVYWKNGHSYGDINDNTYIEDWDSCYRRGLSYSQGEYWNDAVSQFLKAIQERPEDQWRARTFGMNVLDEYFPHRELGIAYLHQGRIRESIKELTLSLSMTDSGKAAYYLNKAHTQWLLEGGWDEKPPVIHFLPEKTDTQEGLFTNSSLYPLEGWAEDDFFVASVFINGKPQYYELAQPTVFFQKKIQLNSGINIITCEANDLMGQSSGRRLNVYLDIQGPLVILSSFFNSALSELSDNASSEKKLTGMVVDDGGIDKLLIGNEEVTLQRGVKVRVFEIGLPSREKSITFKATDLAGNTTQGDLTDMWISSEKASHGQLCANSSYLPLPRGQITTSGRRRQGLNLELLDCPEVVFTPRIVIQGVVTSSTEIIRMGVNETSIFSGQHPDSFLNNFQKVWKNFWKGRDTVFYFTYLYEGLTEGENQITIWAEDKDGVSVTKRIVVEYRIREIDKTGNRWQLAILHFDKYETNKPSLVSSTLDSLNYFDDLLWHYFQQSKRFSMIEREALVPIMREKKFQSYYNQMNKEDLIKIGKILTVEVFLAGAMRVDWNGKERLMEITGRLIDGETGKVLDTQNVYNQWMKKQDEDRLLNCLVYKFIEEFPLAQGIVSGKKHEELTINLGLHDFIKEGMKIIVFRQTDPVKNHKIIEEQKILGEAKITGVYEEASLALPSTGVLWGKTYVGDSVITK